MRAAIFEGNFGTLKIVPMLRTHRGRYRYRADESRSVLVQTDWDYPGLASNLGWVPRNAATRAQNRRCDHSSTDGTVDCACGLTASRMIGSARDWIDARIGRTFPDPGYF